MSFEWYFKQRVKRDYVHNASDVVPTFIHLSSNFKMIERYKKKVSSIFRKPFDYHLYVVLLDYNAAIIERKNSRIIRIRRKNLIIENWMIKEYQRSEVLPFLVEGDADPS